MSAVRFSVVIPTRARDESLARCLANLQKQRGDIAFETIVTDDGASSSTRQMIESTFSGVRWIAGPQRGPAANRNHGASFAIGEFIIFLDDDVEPEPDFISGYQTAIVADVNVYEGRTTCRAGLRSPLENAPVNLTGGWLWSCNMMVRRSFWQAFGGFDEDFPFPHLEDVAFRERLREATEEFVFVPGAVVDHPPRRVPTARTLALRHEAHFIYHYKYLGSKPSPSEFAALFVRVRLRQILGYPPSRDTALAVASMCWEAWHTLTRWREWDRKWRGRRRSTRPFANPERGFDRST
jgi:GT2 family glycosyltransferase